jgi:hypothetical protein
MSVLTEGFTAGHFLASEAPGLRSRDAIVLANAAGAAITVPAGTVLAKQVIGAASKAAKSGGNAANTGDMTLDGTTPVLANAQVGVYTVRCISTASNGGVFRVTAPDGDVLGDVAVAATFANQIKFVIADGSQDFIVGEGFDVTVAAGNGQFVPFLNATNLPAAGVLWDKVVVPAESTAAGVGILRDAEVVAARLQYDATLSGGGLTAAKAAARVSLAAAGIIAR